MELLLLGDTKGVTPTDLGEDQRLVAMVIVSYDGKVLMKDGKEQNQVTVDLYGIPETGREPIVELRKPIWNAQVLRQLLNEEGTGLREGVEPGKVSLARFGLKDTGQLQKAVILTAPTSRDVALYTEALPTLLELRQRGGITTAQVQAPAMPVSELPAPPAPADGTVPAEVVDGVVVENAPF